MPCSMSPCTNHCQYKSQMKYITYALHRSWQNNPNMCHETPAQKLIAAVIC